MRKFPGSAAILPLELILPPDNFVQKKINKWYVKKVLVIVQGINAKFHKNYEFSRKCMKLVYEFGTALRSILSPIMSALGRKENKNVGRL